MKAESTALSRIVVARFGPGEDFFQSLIALCEKMEVESGAITSMIGSLEEATMVCVAKDEKGQARYLDPLYIAGPLEFIGAQGIIGKNEDGTVALHLHGSVAGSDMRPHAGHFVDSGRNRVLATMEVVISVFETVRMVRSFDEETGFVLFKLFRNRK